MNWGVVGWQFDKHWKKLRIKNVKKVTKKLYDEKLIFGKVF